MEETEEAEEYITLEPKLDLLGKISYEEAEVKDPGLKEYISLKPLYYPHTFGRHADSQFKKAEVPIIERLINKLMSPGKGKAMKTSGFGGKKKKTTQIVLQAFEIMKKKSEQNPLQILCQAIENAAPREEIVRVSRGGIYRRYSVDISPQRRIDLALRFLVRGGRKKSRDSPKKIAESLAEEVLLASQDSYNSYAIQQKSEMEKIAANAR